MKYILLLSLFAVTSYAQDLDALDEKNGFRDAIFGDSLSKFSNMKLLEDGGAQKFYERTTDELKAGEAKFESISYGFYKNRLSHIFIKTKGLVNSKAAFRILNTMYGEGEKSNRFIERYWWFGDKCTLSYDENSITGDANIFMSNKEMQSVIKADEEENAKNGAKGF